MRPAVVRVLRAIGAALLAIAGFCVVEVFGLIAGFSVIGILASMVAQPVVLGGIVLGPAALVTGLLRRRSGRPTSGITLVDVVVHAVLLANSLLLLAVHLTPGAGSEPHLAMTVATGAVALVGVPASVWLSWARAFGPVGADAPRTPLRVTVLRASHAVNLAVAAVMVASSIGPLRPLLLGSPLM